MPKGGARVSVMSTLRDVEDQFLVWIEWYRMAGFAHLFLYFDDPQRDAGAICEAREIYCATFLTFVLNGAELQKEWPSLRTWDKFKAFTDDRMCRQLLNLAHCIRRCYDADPGMPEEVDWVFHLDHDELWLPPPQGLQEHFKWLDAGGCRLCLYQNYEAVPEDHTLTPFVDITLFKVPVGRIPKTPMGEAGINFWSDRTKAGNYFLYYDNGKSCCKIRRGQRSEWGPTSVHVLFDNDEFKELARTGRAWTTFPEHELPQMKLEWMVVQSDEVISGAKVLHYPATHYDRLFRKYDHLKNFPAVRFGGQLIVPPSFHLEARDCYVEHMKDGAEVQKQKLAELLERVAMLRTSAEAEAQLQAGTVIRVEAPRESLRVGRFVPPKSIAESMRSRLRRVLCKEALDELQKKPRIDAEVLLEKGGGLLNQPDAGLDAVAHRLETVGWAACTLGAHPGLIRRAQHEAMGVQEKMSPGTTVVQNKVQDASDPRALRGDKMLWLEEQGLNSNNGPCPTLVLLENAVTDIGMQLDSRLQRSRLQLRITERCDGMLACYDGSGAAYGPHIDNADGDGRIDGRILTVILYLNPSWDRSNGGELSIFQPDSGEVSNMDANGKWHNVWPEAGTLVFFRADTMLHEVRPAHAKRFALSMWFCGQATESNGR